MGTKQHVNNDGVVKLLNSVSDPAGVTGGMYYNTTDNKIKVYNGSSWELAGGVSPFYDILDDASIDTGLWTVSTTAASPDGTSTGTEADYYQLTKALATGATGANTSTTLITMDGNFKDLGYNRVSFSVHANATNNTNSAAALSRARVQLIGASTIDLVDNNQPDAGDGSSPYTNITTDGTYHITLIFNSDFTSVDYYVTKDLTTVHKSGTVAGAWTNARIRTYCQAKTEDVLGNRNAGAQISMAQICGGKL